MIRTPRRNIQYTYIHDDDIGKNDFCFKILILIFIFSERDPNRPPPPKTSGKLEFEYFGDRVWPLFLHFLTL